MSGVGVIIPCKTGLQNTSFANIGLTFWLFWNIFHKTCVILTMSFIQNPDKSQTQFNVSMDNFVLLTIHLHVTSNWMIVIISNNWRKQVNVESNMERSNVMFFVSSSCVLTVYSTTQIFSPANRAYLHAHWYMLPFNKMFIQWYAIDVVYIEQLPSGEISCKSLECPSDLCAVWRVH